MLKTKMFGGQPKQRKPGTSSSSTPVHVQQNKLSNIQEKKKKISNVNYPLKKAVTQNESQKTNIRQKVIQQTQLLARDRTPITDEEHFPICLPENLESDIEKWIPTLGGWCTTIKGKILASLVFQMASTAAFPICVELGVFAGRSAFCMALALQTLKRGHIFAIDAYSKQAALEGVNDPRNDEWWSEKVDLEEIRRSVIMNIEKKQLTSIMTLIHNKTDPMSNVFRTESIHVLHQDSNHSEDVSCREVHQWQSKLAPGGYWVFDDSDWPSTHSAQLLLVDTYKFLPVQKFQKWRIFRKPQ